MDKAVESTLKHISIRILTHSLNEEQVLLSTRGVFTTGVATGVYIGIHTPKISPSKLFMG